MGYYIAIALISAATLLLEISLLRLFAVQQFYHFAFMAISLALLGAGASGSWLTVRRTRRSPVALCLIFGLTVVLSYLVINYLPFDSFQIAWEGRQVGYLVIYFLAAAVPFFFAGLLIGEELIAAGQNRGGSHRVYAANLIGSALGSLGSLAVLTVWGGEGAVIVTAVLGLIAGLFFLLENKRHDLAYKWRVSLLSLLILAGIGLSSLWLLSAPPAVFRQQLSPYKTLAILSQALDARHALSVWNATARVDVVESTTIHTMPGLSLVTPADLPLQAGLMIDGDNLMPIIHLDPQTAEAVVLADHLPQGLAYRLRPQADVLVLEAGTGADVLWSLAAGANSVTAVEENRLILDTVRGPYQDFSFGLFQDPRVTVVERSGRVFVRQINRPSYDIAILSLTDPHRPVTSGAYSLSENYLYTVEAIQDYLNVLDEDGLLVVTRWLQTPPSEDGRTFALMARALAESGRSPADHLLAFRTLRTLTIIAGRRPFTTAELDTAQEFWQTRSFDPVFFAGIKDDMLNRFNVFPEPVYHNLFVEILRDPEATFAAYRFDIRPPTDNHPFFYHYFKWGQTAEILATLGLIWQPFGGSGFFVLVALLLLVILAAAVFIISPLLFWRKSRPGGPPHQRFWRGRILIYFACLGLAFLFVEIPLSQRFILMIGQPVTALAVVLFGILLFSGLGSLAVRRLRLTWFLAALILLVVIYPFVLTPVSSLILRWPEGVRLVLLVMVLSPLGFLMGLPFAAGLRIVEEIDPALVPWAWAINGSFSVISSVLAVIVALSWGFSTVLWLGAAAYAGALLIYATLPRPDPATALHGSGGQS